LLNSKFAKFKEMFLSV